MRSLRILVTEMLQVLLIAPLMLVISVLRRCLFRLLRRNKNYVFLGFGPVPIGLNHAIAARAVGLRAESYSTHVYSLGGAIDVRIFASSRALNFLSRFFYVPFIVAIFRYSHLVFYFDGGPFGHGSNFSWKLESILLKIAGVKSIVTAYGSDVHSTRRMTNLSLKNGYNLDYPQQWRRNHRIESRIDYWCKNADFVIAGCDWVDYLPYWDRLVPSHFTIDTRSHVNQHRTGESVTLRVMHAPNHKNLKGTEVIERAVKALRAEGFNIELTLLTGVTHSQVLSEFSVHDLVIDQLIIGWYGQFSIEALANGVPTICFISEEYKTLYASALATENFNLPFIEANVLTLENVLRECCLKNFDFNKISQDGKVFVEKYHSLQTMGELFRQAIITIDSRN